MHPDTLLHRPFTTSEALHLGISPKTLRGPRFRQLFRGVHVAADTTLTPEVFRSAAELAMPDDARLSHLSRLQAAGVEVGATPPVHFTVARDLHLARKDRRIVLHRTEVMLPVDDVGVTPTAALLQHAANVARLDVIRIGDQLLRSEQTSRLALAELAAAHPWRPGAASIQWCIPWMNGRSASFPETDCRVYLVAAGLPEPLVNVPVLDSPDSPIGDLWLPEFLLCIEHEGRHHFTDPEQIRRDTWRYGLMRDHGIHYLQAHREILRRPRQYVTWVHQALVKRGYRGPAPNFGRRWRALHARAR